MNDQDKTKDEIIGELQEFQQKYNSLKALYYKDITGSRKMEMELIKNNEILSLFIELSPLYACILEVTPAGSRVLKASGNYMDMIGVHGSEIVGKTMEELFPSEFAAKITADDWAAVLNGKALKLDEEFNGRNYTTLKYPILKDDKFLLAVYNIDITEYKLAGKEINEELRRINSEKDKFLSIIAHDLRSPFSALLGLTRLMAEELPSLKLDEIQKMAAAIKNSASKFFNLLENLLEWSQVQGGLRNFRPESFVLSNGISPIIEIVQDTADKKMISIHNDVPEDLRLMADKQMFGCLMRNLVFNAIKFTPKGGIITIGAKAVSDTFVEISIKDTGIGMNKDMIDNLFHPAVNTNRLGTEGEPCNGLGLIISKDFVEKHGGTIRVESEEGNGSTFYFTLPKTLQEVANPLSPQ